MVSHHCARCARPLDGGAFSTASVAQCPYCGYIGAGVGAVAVALPQAPPVARPFGRPPPVPPPVARPKAGQAEPGESAGWPRPFIALLAACAAATLAALVFGHTVTRIAVPLLALAVLNGYRVGGLKVASGVLGLLAGALLGVPVGRWTEGLTGPLLGFSGLSGRLVSILVAGVLLAVLASFLLDHFLGRRLRERPAAARWDRWVGSGLGAAQGLLLVFVVLWGVLSLEPVAAARMTTPPAGRDTGADDPTAARIAALAGAVHDSFLGRAAEAVNPVADSRVVTLPNKCVQLLGDPEALRRFNDHPAIRRVRDRPAVREVLAVLAQDPQIQEVLASEEGISRRDLAVLLNNPKLLEAIDHSDVMGELSPIADDIERAVDDALADQPGLARASPPR